MENIPPHQRLTQKFKGTNRLNLILGGILIFALVAGIGTGYVLANTSAKNNPTVSSLTPQIKPNNAQQDNRTFRDFAEGKIAVKPQPKDPSEYTEGTHILIRENAVPVALTSSVVDLSLYEGKNVKVFGETQKAVKEGWLMDVGKVEEIN